ncbi:MAG TPA: ATP-binding protein [Steroidobacteraceae bacterium]
MNKSDRLWLAGLELQQQVALLDAEGTILRCSEAWRLCADAPAGDRPRWRAGSRFLEGFAGPPYTADDCSRIAAALSAAWTNVASTGCATYSRGEANDLSWHRLTFRPYAVQSQRYVLVTHEDITEEDRATQKVRADEERWMLALEVNDVGVWDFDVLANTVVGSRRWTELLNQTAPWCPDMIPLPTALVHTDDLPRFEANWDALLLGTLPALEAGVRLRVDEVYRYMRLRGRVVKRSAAGEALRVVGTMVDIHEAVLKQKQAANASKLESIGQLAAGIAHEINTPVQYVGDNVRFLGDAFSGVQQCFDALTSLVAGHEEAVPSAEVRSHLARADISYLREEIPKAITQSLDGIGRIAQIVGAMKEFSHPGQDRTPTDINHAIVNSITVATNEWKYVATIDTDLDAALPLVPVIPGEFNQVILNIIVNAAHAVGDARAADGKGKGTIRVVTRQVGQWAEVAITDDGCGMLPHVQEKIFDPFFTTKAVGKGTGQGLSIAHAVIVTKHRGTIAVSSEPGKGTTFLIRVPLKLDELRENAA